MTQLFWRRRPPPLPFFALLGLAYACGDAPPSAPDHARKVPAALASGPGGGGGLSPIPLGTLGGDSTHALDLNNRGDVVGWSRDGEGNRRPFLWSPGDGMVDLGTLGGDKGVAMGINDSRTVVGWSRNEDEEQLATRWDVPGEPLELEPHDFGDPRPPSAAMAVNPEGVAVGSTHGVFLARWGPDGSALDMEGCPNGIALDVNPRGDAVGIASTVVGAFIHDPFLGEAGADREFSGFVWTEEEGCQGLIDDDFVAYDVQGMNSRGQIVGLGGEWVEVTAGIIELTSSEIPFRHDRRRGFLTERDLPAMPRDVNNRGTVVGDGIAAINEPGDRVGGAYLWTARPRRFGRHVAQADVPFPGPPTRSEPRRAGARALDAEIAADCPPGLLRLVEIGALPECPLTAGALRTDKDVGPRQ